MKYLLMARQVDKVGRKKGFSLFRAASKPSIVAIGRKRCVSQYSVGKGLSRCIGYPSGEIGSFEVGNRQ